MADIKETGEELHLETLGGETVNIENRDIKEKALVRRIDKRMMPLMMLLYILNYLDRNNIATARLGNFEADIGLVAEQYNTVISIFFVGYILTQVPTNMILNKMRLSIFLSYHGMIALRFILGFVEAPFFPGALFLFSSWYTKKELAVRISVLYAAGQMAGAFGGLLGSAIMAVIIEGCATYPTAIVTYLVVPDYPATTAWLSDEERRIAVLRMAEDASKEDDRADVSAWEGARMAFTDPAPYMI
ncbi:allantoate permease [Fusarium agapanthi]|uniref:Allantoate permease n=1 Tax=Fusarium agapanthi TaxID=1803897 RepID=A0A9P5BEK6_9HYPO|nr:allantoate permease [Fusarium agapanthi]